MRICGLRRTQEVAIRDDDTLLRRVIFADPKYCYTPEGRPTSASFLLRKGEVGLSVDLERLTTHQRAVVDPRKYKLFGFKASVVRVLGLCCWHAPLADNRAHSLIGPATNAPEKFRDFRTLQPALSITKTLARALAEAAAPVDR